MASELAEQQCVPCEGGVPPMEKDKAEQMLSQLNGWTIEQQYHLTRTFKFRNFAKALDFVNRVGEIAEDQNHHPDIHLAYGKAKVEVWTHKINGLTESDFVFAAKVDQAHEQLQAQTA